MAVVGPSDFRGQARAGCPVAPATAPSPNVDPGVLAPGRANGRPRNKLRLSGPV